MVHCVDSGIKNTSPSKRYFSTMAYHLPNPNKPNDAGVIHQPKCPCASAKSLDLDSEEKPMGFKGFAVCVCFSVFLFFLVYSFAYYIVGFSVSFGVISVLFVAVVFFCDFVRKFLVALNQAGTF